MPTISRFHGIVIFMNYNDHNPPHFHARYGEEEITVDVDTGLVQGKMSKRALKMILDWYELHRDALRTNWERARNRHALDQIPPLP